MKKLYIILGNGFTIDFLNHYVEFDKTIENLIDVKNLFHYGDMITPPWNKIPGMLSYKITPELWKLGAKANISAEASNALIEEIITCANMFFDFINDKQQKEQRLQMLDSKPLHLKAYAELLVYLRQLFSYYNDIISDTKLRNFVEKNKTWGWIPFLKKIETYEQVAFITYNYDIWLERILFALDLKFEVYGFCDTEDRKSRIEIIKPHGSISFIPKQNNRNRYSINYQLNMEEASLRELQLTYEKLGEVERGAIIPPAGDSSRLSTETWAKSLRDRAISIAQRIDENDDVILCGMSYGYVDRKEIDAILLSLSEKCNFIFLNPSPPRDLNAVLMTIFPNYVLLSSSDKIGGILNDKTV